MAMQGAGIWDGAHNEGVKQPETQKRKSVKLVYACLCVEAECERG